MSPLFEGSDRPTCAVVDAIKRGEWPESTCQVSSHMKALEADRDRLRLALLDVLATCDGQVMCEPRRASYAGIANYIRALHLGDR